VVASLAQEASTHLTEVLPRVGEIQFTNRRFQREKQNSREKPAESWEGPKTDICDLTSGYVPWK